MKYGVGLNDSYSLNSCSGKLKTVHCMSEFKPTRKFVFWATTSSFDFPAAVKQSTLVESGENQKATVSLGFGSSYCLPRESVEGSSASSPSITVSE